MAFLEVFFIRWIERCSSSLNFDVTLDWNVAHPLQAQGFFRSIFLYHFATEHGAALPHWMKVPGVNPVTILIPVSTPCPVPQCAPDAIVDF
jgi:hypothetical protein